MLHWPQYVSTTRTCLRKHVHDALRACWYFEVPAIDIWAWKRNDTILTRDEKYSLSPMRLNSWTQSSQAFCKNADVKTTQCWTNTADLAGRAGCKILEGNGERRLATMAAPANGKVKTNLENGATTDKPFDVMLWDQEALIRAAICAATKRF